MEFELGQPAKLIDREHSKNMATALVTGASAGLGEEFAYALAREKYDLVLTARREERLKSIAQKARKAGAPNVRVIAADLSKRDVPSLIERQLEADAVKIDYLVNNAGFGTRGRIDQMSVDRELEEIDLNIRALVELTRVFVPAMVARKKGTIINVSSVAGFTPIPFMATYAATKAFVLSFSEAIAAELAGTGVTVTALCPGLTRTEFQKVAKADDTSIPEFVYMDARTVVEQGIAAARMGLPIYVNGPMNFMMTEMMRLMPRGVMSRITAALTRIPGSS
jgi:short-subunit dehydrogenase